MVPATLIKAVAAEKVTEKTEAMNVLVPFGVLLLLAVSELQAELKSPQVNVYPRHPVENGKQNIVICYAKGFYPPNLKMMLKCNGEPVQDVGENDLGFHTDWTYQKMIFTHFTPGDDSCSCDVQHGDQPVISYMLDPLM